MNNLFIRVFNKDQWINGLIAGVFIPIVLFAGMIYLFESLHLLTIENPGESIQILRPRTLALMALCTNVILMQSFKSLRWDRSMRGLAVATFICIALWLYKYGRELL